MTTMAAHLPATPAPVPNCGGLVPRALNFRYWLNMIIKAKDRPSYLIRFRAIV